MNGKSKYVLLGSSESFACLKNSFSVSNQYNSYSRRNGNWKHLGKISKPNKTDWTCLTVWVVYKDLNTASEQLLTEKYPPEL